jgi:hypothetical protein
MTGSLALLVTEGFRMSNSTLVQRMRDALARFEHGQCGAAELERQFSACMASMECIRLADVHQAEELLQRFLLCQSFPSDEGDPEPMRKHLCCFLDSLPVG